MVNVFGTTMSKREFLRYFGDATAFAGIVPMTLENGKAAGVKALRIYTGAGLDFTVLPGRAMDIAWASYNSKSLVFISKTGVTSPIFYEARNKDFLRTFYGGLLTTCGLTYFGSPDIDNGEELSLHGREANNITEDVSIHQKWDGDELTLSVEGRMREAQMFGENIILTRKIWVKAGENIIHLEDSIENLGFTAQPYMLLYHINYGFPLVSPDTKLYTSSTEVSPRDNEAAADDGVANYSIFDPPLPGYKEKCYFHTFRTDNEGNTTLALINEPLNLGIWQRWNINELPAFTQWKNLLEGDYVLGLEPGTATPIGRSKVREQGQLLMIEPGEMKHVGIEFGIMDSPDKFTLIKDQIDRLN